MSRKGKNPKGTDNVLVDLGFEDAGELSVKATLALKLNELIDERGLSQDRSSRDHRHDSAQDISGSALQASEHLA